MLRLTLVALLCAAGGTAAHAQKSQPVRASPSERSAAQPPARARSATAEAALEAGDYMLVLTPARVGGKPVPQGAEPIASVVKLTRVGGELRLTSADGLSLTGSASDARVVLSGSNGATKLILTGVSSPRGADGDFQLTSTSAPAIEGGFVLTSPNSAGLQATRQLRDDATRPKSTASCDWWCTLRREVRGRE